MQLITWTSVRCVRFLPLAVQPRRRAGSRSSRSHLRPDLNATCHFFHHGGRRAEGGEEGEGGEGRSEGGVYRKRHKWRIRFLEQTLLPVDPGERWGNTLGVMEAK